MHLYRIITDVRSGPAREGEGGPRQRGIATVWVKADSEQDAIERGRDVLNERHYARTGELTIFREENTHLETDWTIDPLDSLAARYTALKLEALRRCNGLFELWLPALN